MDNLDGKYIKIPALTLFDLGVEDWEAFHQEAYYIAIMEKN